MVQLCGRFWNYCANTPVPTLCHQADDLFWLARAHVPSFSRWVLLTGEMLELKPVWIYIISQICGFWSLDFASCILKFGLLTLYFRFWGWFRVMSLRFSSWALALILRTMTLQCSFLSEHSAGRMLLVCICFIDSFYSEAVRVWCRSISISCACIMIRIWWLLGIFGSSNGMLVLWLVKMYG